MRLSAVARKASANSDPIWTPIHTLPFDFGLLTPGNEERISRVWKCFIAEGLYLVEVDTVGPRSRRQRSILMVIGPFLFRKALARPL